MLAQVRRGKNGEPIGLTKRVITIARGSGTSVREVEECVVFLSTPSSSLLALTADGLPVPSLLMQHHMMGNMAKTIGGAQPKANPCVPRSPSLSPTLAPLGPTPVLTPPSLAHTQERGARGKAAGCDGRAADGPRRPAEPAADDGDPGAFLII